jgi:probable rRNA maturation factor
MREVSIANRHPRLRMSRREVARLIETLDANAPAIGLRLSAIPTGELSLVFLTDAALAKLHADFLDDPSPTDVITFEGDRSLGTAGEICVSVDAAGRHVGLPLVAKRVTTARRRIRQAHRRQAPALQKQFSDELTLYVVHGWLHLAGHDDLMPAKKRAMRRAEARAMRVLERAGALPRFSLRPAP